VNEEPAGTEPKRSAASELDAAAQAVMPALGLVRRSGSRRNWIGDRGWWLLHVWFPPEGVAVPMSVLVGTQHPWTLQPGWQIDDDVAWGEGIAPEDITGGSVQGEGEGAAAVQVRLASDTVRHIDRVLADEQGHLEMLAHIRPRGTTLGIGVRHVTSTVLANAALGRIPVCRHVLELQRNSLHIDPDRDQDWFGLDDQLAVLSQLDEIVAAADPRPLIAQRLQSGRARLGLPPTNRLPAPLR
jgi:hypothetical protein